MRASGGRGSTQTLGLHRPPEAAHVACLMLTTLCLSLCAGVYHYHGGGEGGGRVSWAQLTTFQKCNDKAAQAAGYHCRVFEAPGPRTVAMSVLVVVEMFNALNNLSEESRYGFDVRAHGLCHACAMHVPCLNFD